jgi:acyl dehydratase
VSVRVISGVDALAELVDQQLGVGDWLTVDQELIDAFADLTDDHQWIHVDPARAAAGPYGTTIAHGYLMVALLPKLVRSVYRVEGVTAAINYGSNRVRFPAPVPAGSRVRATADLVAVDDVPGGIQTTVRVTVERDGSDRPVLIAETIARWLR